MATRLTPNTVAHSCLELPPRSMSPHRFEPRQGATSATGAFAI
jgi:hypothetical protein